LGIDSSRIAVGVVANLYPHKNPGLAIKAISRIPSDRRDKVLLAFFGDGPLRNDLAALAKRLGVENQVRFYGFRTDMAELWTALDLMLTTSLREMMPISLLEAMNAALPIIGPPNSGVLDLVEHGVTGIISKSWNDSELADAIDWAISRPIWCADAGRAGYTRLRKNFDIEVVSNLYADLYCQLRRRNRAAS
jgi:glycosyltransferase involved in cell wall biosynthesis